MLGQQELAFRDGNRLHDGLIPELATAIDKKNGRAVNKLTKGKRLFPTWPQPDKTWHCSQTAVNGFVFVVTLCLT